MLYQSGALALRTVYESCVPILLKIIKKLILCNILAAVVPVYFVIHTVLYVSQRPSFVVRHLFFLLRSFVVQQDDWYLNKPTEITGDLKVLLNNFLFGCVFFLEYFVRAPFEFLVLDVPFTYKIKFYSTTTISYKVLVAHDCNHALGGQEQGMVWGLLGLLSSFKQWFSNHTLANFKLAMGRIGSCSLPL